MNEETLPALSTLAVCLLSLNCLIYSIRLHEYFWPYVWGAICLFNTISFIIIIIDKK